MSDEAHLKIAPKCPRIRNQRRPINRFNMKRKAERNQNARYSGRLLSSRADSVWQQKQAISEPIVIAETPVQYTASTLKRMALNGGAQ